MLIISSLSKKGLLPCGTYTLAKTDNFYEYFMKALNSLPNCRVICGDKNDMDGW